MSPKRLAPRLAVIDEANMNDAQRTLLDSLRAGPRGVSITPRGPFAVWMHAPELGELAQKLGAHCRYKTALPPRLSERVSDRVYKRVQTLLGDAALVELVGILGYYVLISMTLNVFRM